MYIFSFYFQKYYWKSKVLIFTVKLRIPVSFFRLIILSAKREFRYENVFLKVKVEVEVTFECFGARSGPEED